MYHAALRYVCVCYSVNYLTVYAFTVAVRMVRQLVAVSASRWLLVPLATAGLLTAAIRLGLVARDPVLLFVIMMEVRLINMCIITS
jgi:hypothetical protein